MLDLNSPYPEHDIFLKVLTKTSRVGREVLVNVFLTEGTPKAFFNSPAVYEFLRRWLGGELEISSKQITVLGSARIGFSLAPYKFGRKFGEDSDLDLSIISEEIFEKLKKESIKFINDYENKNIIPDTKTRRSYWEANIKFLKKNLPQGFIDINKIPFIKERYPYCQHLGNLMWRLKEKINATPNALRIKKVSLRIYKDWSRLIDRVSINLLWLIEENKKYGLTRRST